MEKIISVLLVSILSVSIGNAIAQTGRTVKDISNNEWKLWLDTAAIWQHDSLFAPPVNIHQLPVNIPTGGWNALQQATGKQVHLPAVIYESIGDC